MKPFNQTIIIMKKTILIAAFAAALISCNKEMPVNHSDFFSEDQPSVLTVIARGSETKGVQSTDEAKVNSLTVFVFKNNGTIRDAYATSNTPSLSVSVSYGSRSIWAVVNAEEDLSGILTEAELLAKVSLLANNTGSKFVMIGSGNKTIDSSSATVQIPVNRLAAKVKIAKITNNLPSAYSGKTFTVERVFLANVVGNCLYDCSTPASPVWHATTTLNENGGQKNLIMTTYNTTDGSSLYCYPNSSSTKTTVVAEISIGSDKYTYPIQIPSVNRNTVYQINDLVITRPGNPTNGDDNIDDGEITPISLSSMSTSLMITDWTVVLLGNSGTVTI